MNTEIACDLCDETIGELKSPCGIRRCRICCEACEKILHDGNCKYKIRGTNDREHGIYVHDENS